MIDPYGLIVPIDTSPYDPEWEEAQKERREQDFYDIEQGAFCPVTIRPREPSTYDQISWGLGIKIINFRGPEYGHWKWRGQWFEGWHFHLGWGPLKDHHLPQQTSNWIKNLINVINQILSGR